MADLQLDPIVVSGNPQPVEKKVTWSFFGEAGAAEPEGGRIATRMKDAGFNDGEVTQWRQKHASDMKAAGFSQEEIDKDMGVAPPPNMTGVQKFVNDNLSAHDQAIADAEDKKAGGESVVATKPGAVIPTQNGGVAPDAVKVPVTDTSKPDTWYERLIDSMSKGWGSSVTGMLDRNKLPESLPEDAQWAEKMAYSTAALAGDTPFMIGGALAGGTAGSTVPVIGTAVGAGVGAFAVPAMIRHSLVENLRNGSVKDVGDFAQRTMGMLYDGIKQGTVGALTVATGGAVGAATKAAGPLISATAQTTAELATMVTAGKALERELPTADDFTTAAVLVAALHGSVAIAKASPKAMDSIGDALANIYVKTGIKPHDVAEMAKNDPTIAQDIISGQDIPDALKDHIDPTLRAETIPKLPTAPEVPLGKEPTGDGNVSPNHWKNVADKIDFTGTDKKEPFSFRSLYTRVINDLHPIFADQKAMLKSLDKPLRDLPADKAPYTLAQNSRGTFGRADQQLEHGTYDFNSYKNNGAGLKQILDPIKDDLKGWATYAVAKRSLELSERGIDGGIPLADAQEVVRGGAAKFESINNEVIAFQNRVSKQLRDSGIISAEMYDHMLDLNKNYTPFFRVMNENSGVGIGSGLNTNNPIHSIRGSERQIINPLESIVKNTYVYTALAERNAVGKAYLDLAEQTGHSQDWLSKVNPDVKGTTVSEKEMAKFLSDNGIEGMPSELLTVFRALRSPLEDNQIAVFTDGKRDVYELKNAETAAAFKGVDAQTANVIVKILSIPAALLRAGATGRSPDFMLRNPMRDQVSAFIYGNNIPVVDMLSGVYSLIRKDAAFQNWLKGGGANAAMVSIDRDYLQEKLHGMGLDKLDEKTGLASRAWNVAKTPLDIMQIMSELMENMTRVGVFKRNQGSEPTKADILQAANTSREASLDFAKKGSQMRAMNMITDFFSANLNGLDKMARTLKDNPAGFLTRVAVGVTLPSVLLYEAQKDDPRWSDGSIPQWQKDLFYIVLTKDHIYRIPKDFQLGVIFGSGAEHMLQAFDDYNKGKSLDTQSLANYFATLWGSTVPPIIPTAAVPLLEQATNHSFFSGQKLVPDAKEKLLPEYQYNDYTTELTKKIGSLVGTFPGMRSDLMPEQAKNLASPMVIDNYVRQWTGGLGNYVVQLADYALRKVGMLPDPVKATATLADIPVVKAFVVRYPSAQAQGIQDFYAREASNQKFYDTIQTLAKAGDIVGLQRELGLKPNQNVDLVKLNQATAMMGRMPGIKQALGNMTRAVHAINLDPNSSASDKRQLIDSIYYQMIQLSKAGNDSFRMIDDMLGRSLLLPPPPVATP